MNNHTGCDEYALERSELREELAKTRNLLRRFVLNHFDWVGEDAEDEDVVAALQLLDIKQ